MTWDLAGSPRPLDGNADLTAEHDMGAYEFVSTAADTDGDRMLDRWELDHGLNPVNAADAQGNLDADAMSNLEEFCADTNPTNASSFLSLLGIALEGSDIRISWQGGILATQFLERCDTLTTNPVAWTVVLTNLPPALPLTNRLDLSPVGIRHYYRIRATR